MHARPPAVFVGLALLASGCGNERPADVPLARPLSSEAALHRFPAAGLSLELPKNVVVRRSSRPGVFRGAVGEGFVSAFAYRRKEQIPRTDRELEKARKRLESAVKKREDGYSLGSSRVTRIDGARAVDLVGDQTISQRRLRIRSLHIYRGKAEYVIELAAPVGGFEAIDRAVSPLLRRTVDVSGKVRAGGR